MSEPRSPTVGIYPHTGCDDLDLVRLEGRVEAAMPFCLNSRGTVEAVLSDLEEVEVSLIDDEAIAAVHGEFLEDPTPTDVITFHHGEILVSVETARREGEMHGKSAEEETLLYIIHGLLHLNGHTDLKEPDRTAMHREQESILERVLRPLPHPPANSRRRR